MAEAVTASAPPDVTDSFQEFECKICYNYFDLDRRLPKLLGCSHTFCHECLDELHSREGRGWRICCPMCRHRTPVPEYRIHNLPDNSALTESLPLPPHEPVVSSHVDIQTNPSVSTATSPESEGGCHAYTQIVFVTGSVCAVFSFLCMVVLLIVGLNFVHIKTTWPVGPVCLFVASVLALFSLILTWLMCTLKYRPETEASNFSSLNNMT